MGYADGGGDTVNVWRAVSHMEAILQALSYPEIGTIVSTAANFDPDPAVAANDIRFLIQRGVDFIVGYPDAGVAIADAIKEADDAGIPYVSFSAGWVGLPGQEGALVPGKDYLTVVGEDLCALGKCFAEVLNDGVGTGEVAILGGTPGNALSLGWQRCTIPSLASGLDLVDPPANEDSTTGDTTWYPPAIPGVYQRDADDQPGDQGLGVRIRRRDVHRAADVQGPRHPGEEPHRGVAHRRAGPVLRLGRRNEPTYHIWYSAGGNFQSRIGVTAAMMSLQGAAIPAEVVVPHVMREVTARTAIPIGLPRPCRARRWCRTRSCS